MTFATTAITCFAAQFTRTRAGCAGVPDADWPSWYAAYMIAEQAGTELPT